MDDVPEGYFAIIGNYFIGKTIGQGTFGKVKLGLHTLTMQNVAIKILEKDKILDEADQIRVQREIQILRKIRHPNIIQLYEIIESNKQIFLITEYAPNSELFNYIVKRSKLNERQAAKFLLQIINAVEYLHENQIVHRDLKPENLLLDHNDSIKVVDFGLSNSYQEGETLKTACGSPCYAAPEMVSGKRYYGLKTDLWSSGIIVYAMLCGYLPFEDSNTTELYKKIISSPLKLPEYLSERSKSLMNGMLEKDPEKRFTISDIRRHDFCTMNTNQPILRGIIVGQSEILVDPLILSLLKQFFQIENDQAKQYIQNNKHNQITATYYLLLNAHLRNGGVSVADLSRSQSKKTQSAPSQDQTSSTSPERSNANKKASIEDFQKPIDKGSPPKGSPKKNDSTNSSPMKKMRELLLDERSPRKQKVGENEDKQNHKEPEVSQKREKSNQTSSKEQSQDGSSKLIKKQNFVGSQGTYENKEQEKQKCPPLPLSEQAHLQEIENEISSKRESNNNPINSNNKEEEEDNLITPTVKAIVKLNNKNQIFNSSIQVPKAQPNPQNTTSKKIKISKENFIDGTSMGDGSGMTTLSERESQGMKLKLKTEEQYKDNNLNHNELADIESPMKYKISSYKIGKFVVGQHQPPISRNSRSNFQDQNVSENKIKMGTRTNNMHNHSISTAVNQSNIINPYHNFKNSNIMSNSICNVSNTQQNISAVAAAAPGEILKADISPQTGPNSSLSLKNYLIKSSISGLKNTFNKNFTGIIQNISKNSYQRNDFKGQQAETSMSQHRRNETDVNSSYYQNGYCFKADSPKKRRVATEEDFEFKPIEEEKCTSKNTTKISLKIHHKAAKSESTDNNSNRKNIQSQKENIEEEVNSQQQNIQQKETISNAADKSSNEKISAFLRQPLQKASLQIPFKETNNSLSLGNQNAISKNLAYTLDQQQQQQQQPSFFMNPQQKNNPSSSLSTSIQGNNTTLQQPQLVSNKDSTQQDQIVDMTSVRQKLKQISQKIPGSIHNSFKVRVRKSATPESHLIQNSLNYSENNSSSQRRSNSNLNNPSFQNNQEQPSYSPPKIDGQNQTKTVSSHRLVSAGKNTGKSYIQSNHSENGAECEYNLKPAQQQQPEVSKVRTINDSPLYKREKQISQSTGGVKYYMGLKQQSISKEQYPGNSSINNEYNQINISQTHAHNQSVQGGNQSQQISNIPSNLNNISYGNSIPANSNNISNSINSSSTQDDPSQKTTSKKSQNWAHQNAYYLNPPPVASSCTNKSAYFNSSTINAAIQNRFSNQQQQQNSDMVAPSTLQTTNGIEKSDSTKIKIPTSAIIPNSYSFANVTKYKIRKQSKLSQGNMATSGSILNSTNGGGGVNNISSQIPSSKEKQVQQHL